MSNRIVLDNDLATKLAQKAVEQGAVCSVSCVTTMRGAGSVTTGIGFVARTGISPADQASIITSIIAKLGEMRDAINPSDGKIITAGGSLAI